MKFFQKASDGGKDSGVTAYFLFEIKWLASVALLHFRDGSREAYHSHAFNAVTLWLRGSVIESRIFGYFNRGFYASTQPYGPGEFKYTSRSNMHKVISKGDSWALTFRGPWAKTGCFEFHHYVTIIYKEREKNG